MHGSRDGRCVTSLLALIVLLGLLTTWAANEATHLWAAGPGHVDALLKDALKEHLAG